MFLVALGCYSLLRSEGGRQERAVHERTIEPADVAVIEGYRVEVVAQGLNFPAGVTFDDAGGVYVVESGYAYGEKFDTPRIVKVAPDGPRVVASGREPPWSGVTWHQGAFYVAEGGVRAEGRILRIGEETTVLADHLPSMGDHHVDGPVVGPDGRVYFGIGTATNAGVVAMDDRSWVKRHAGFHDIPCEDVELRGEDFRSLNLVSPGVRLHTKTGAFVPFGTPTRAGQIVEGRVPCSGGVFRMNEDGSDLSLVAWGFRNPFGLAFHPDGRLFATDNGYDNKGSRPIFGAGDWLWEVQQGAWYGFPDFVGGKAVGKFHKAPRKKTPTPLLGRHPGKPPSPVATLAVHGSADGFDFSRSDRFGYVGQAFIATFGDMAPAVGKIMSPAGYEVLRVDVQTGDIEVFATNRGRVNGPASRVGGGGFERPVAARFDPTGSALYVVDYGVFTVTKTGLDARPGSGVLWRVVRE